jgi:hypothetical protein
MLIPKTLSTPLKLAVVETQEINVVLTLTQKDKFTFITCHNVFRLPTLHLCMVPQLLTITQQAQFQELQLTLLGSNLPMDFNQLD